MRLTAGGLRVLSKRLAHGPQGREGHGVRPAATAPASPPTRTTARVDIPAVGTERAHGGEVGELQHVELRRGSDAAAPRISNRISPTRPRPGLIRRVTARSSSHARSGGWILTPRLVRRVVAQRGRQRGGLVDAYTAEAERRERGADLALVPRVLLLVPLVSLGLLSVPFRVHQALQSLRRGARDLEHGRAKRNPARAPAARSPRVTDALRREEGIRGGRRLFTGRRVPRVCPLTHTLQKPRTLLRAALRTRPVAPRRAPRRAHVHDGPPVLVHVRTKRGSVGRRG